MSYKLAVVGATGNVGKEILSILDERKFPAREVVALASKTSMGKEVSFGERVLLVQDLAQYDFTGTDIALFSPGAKISEQYAPIAAKSGCVVIDNTSFFRMKEDVPLIIPEVNPNALKGYTKSNIIANPNCSTIQMLVVLKPLHDYASIKRIVVSTYQAVSGSGKEAMDELYGQTRSKYEIGQAYEPQCYTKEIAFNAIPHIDVFMEDGDTKEEWKMIQETKKILSNNIGVSATCVRIPVFNGHAESVNVEFEYDINEEDIFDILHDAKGVIVFDRRADGGYVTPIEVSGEDAVFTSRIRIDKSIKNACNLWIVADNLRKGAALNAVQIAETLVKKYM